MCNIFSRDEVVAVRRRTFGISVLLRVGIHAVCSSS